MSNFNWCHGPECHKKHTVDRVRGVKGSKVLRTRKVKVGRYGNYDRGENNVSMWDYFCNQSCLMDFIRLHLTSIITIAPRTECLETPIENPTKERSEYGWVNWNIKVDETRQS